MTEEQRFTIKPGLVVSGVALPVMAVISLYAWFQLPADVQIPVHWGIDGQPDRYGGKVEGLLMTPVIAAVMTAILAAIPWFEPRRLHFQQSRRAYLAIWIGTMVLLLAIHVALVLTALGRPMDVPLIVPTAVGILFIVIGSFLSKIRSNFFMGIRTPWTLSSELSWTKTHRLGGKLFIAMGILLMLTPWLPATGAAVTGVVVFAFIMISILFVYSYLIWKNDPDKQTLGR